MGYRSKFILSKCYSHGLALELVVYLTFDNNKKNEKLLC